MSGHKVVLGGGRGTFAMVLMCVLVCRMQSEVAGDFLRGPFGRQKGGSKVEKRGFLGVLFCDIGGLTWSEPELSELK